MPDDQPAPRTCASCGSAVAEDARFCASCGARLDNGADERRMATVVIGDIVDFTALSERMDPEHLKALVDRLFERLAHDVERFGGRVDKIIGDAIVALFGAPTSHGDDPERAVRAALQMQRTVAEVAGSSGHDMRMRFGVNTGEVIVGVVRGANDITAMGDAVNVAARLEHAAKGGQVLIGDVTAQAVEGAIELRSIGRLSVKGRDGKVAAHEAIHERRSPGERPASDVPFVGREAELSLLTGAVDTALRRNVGEVVLIVGDTGLGKRRLAEEVVRRTTASHPGLHVVRTACQPYGSGTGWQPLASLLPQIFGSDPDDVQQEVAELLEREPDDEQVRRVLAGLRPLLRDDAEADGGEDELVRSLVTLIESCGRFRRLLLVITDLQWADDVVLTVLDRLAARISHLPVVLLLTARPSLSWSPATFPNVVRCQLEPMDDAEVAALATALTDSPVDAEALAELQARAGGNPLFVEELLRASGGELKDVDRLPTSVQGLLGARLDALSPTARRVVEDMAVVGVRGRLDTVAAVGAGDAHLAEVAETLVSDGVIQLTGDTYRFRAEAMRDVAYDRLTHAERRQRHDRAAEWLEQAVEGPSDVERLQRAAEHRCAMVALQGGDSRDEEAARQRALQTLVRVVDWAVQRDLVDLIVRAVGLAEPLADPEQDAATLRELRLHRARARWLRGDLDGARRDADEVRDEAQDIDDVATEARALTLLGAVDAAVGRTSRAADRLGRAVEKATMAGDQSALGSALRELGLAQILRGDHEAADDTVRRALDLFEELGEQRGIGWAHQHLGWIAFLRGDPVAADHHVEVATDEFERLADWSGLVWTRLLGGWVEYGNGNLDAAEEAAIAGVVDGRELGEDFGLGLALTLLALVRLWRGRAAEAVEHAKSALEVVSPIGHAYGELQANLALGRASAALGDLETLRSAFKAAKRVADRISNPGADAFYLLFAIATAAQQGDVKRARSLVKRLEVPLEGFLEGQRITAMVHLLEGDPDRSVELLEEALETPGTSSMLVATRALLAVALAAAGRPEDVVTLADDDRRAGTYLDDALWGLGLVLAFAQQEDWSAVADELGGLAQLAGRTDDRWLQALVELCRAALLHDDDDKLEDALATWHDVGGKDTWLSLLAPQKQSA